MEAIKRGVARFLFWASLPFLRLIFPMKVHWEDKQATVEALKNTTVLFSNHRGYVEGLYLTRYFHRFRVWTYVGLDWYSKPKINWLFRNMNYIPVDRQQMDTGWLDAGVEKIKDGGSIYILPEGHTSKDGVMDEFKPGFLMIAKRVDANLVPIYLSGKITKFKKVDLVVGKPLHLDLHEKGRPSQVMKAHSETCKAEVARLKELLEQGQV